MSTSLLLLLFIFSNLGMFELLRRKTSINKYFFPSCIIAIETSILFFAGILNILKEASYTLWIFGIFYLFYMIYCDKGIHFIKEYFTPGYIFCVITLFCMLIFVHGKVFSLYDNFSHWALVVKSMLHTDRFPNFMDKTIMFQEYPLGSAIYIYYFSKMINNAEEFQMLAQIYMILAAIMPLFIFIKKNIFPSIISIVAITNLFFVYNISITNLLVDTLLPLVSLAGLLFVYLYSKNNCDKFMPILFAAYLIQMVQIKNSGIFLP